MKVIATVTGPLKKYVGEFSTFLRWCQSILFNAMTICSREGCSCVSNNWCPRLSRRTPGDPLCPFNWISIDFIQIQRSIDIYINIMISKLCPDFQDLWERVHWVQRDQPQFGDAGHRESWSRSCLSQPLGDCEERPSKSACQLNHQDGSHQNCIYRLLIVQNYSFLGHLACWGSIYLEE